MWTETLGQMIDRMIIANLKVYHYTQAGKDEAAELAQQQVTELSAAVSRYASDCFNLRILPRVQRHLRFHDHNAVEAWRQGKQATPKAPDSIPECISALVMTHSDYWEAQTRLQTLKQLIDRTTVDTEVADFEHEFVHLQRQHIDLDNQFRNELIQRLDTLFVSAVEEATGYRRAS